MGAGQATCMGVRQLMGGNRFCSMADRQHGTGKMATAKRRNIYCACYGYNHVATGDGGKNALPQDHNRDSTEKTPHWNEVAAVQKQVLTLAKEERLRIFLDLHNPGPAGKQLAVYVMNKEYVGAEAPPLQEQFLDLVVKQFGSYKRNESKPPALNSQIFYAVSEPWVAAHGNANTIGFCVETPWNTPQGTIEGYKATGEKLAQVTQAYLSSF